EVESWDRVERFARRLRELAGAGAALADSGGFDGDPLPEDALPAWVRGEPCPPGCAVKRARRAARRPGSGTPCTAAARSGRSRTSSPPSTPTCARGPGGT